MMISYNQDETHIQYFGHIFSFNEASEVLGVNPFKTMKIQENWKTL